MHKYFFLGGGGGGGVREWVWPGLIASMVRPNPRGGNLNPGRGDGWGGGGEEVVGVANALSPP